MTVSECIQQNYSEIVSIKIKDKYIAYFKREPNGVVEILHIYDNLKVVSWSINIFGALVIQIDLTELLGLIYC